MLGRMIVPNYLDPSSSIVDVDINQIEVQNTLIDIGIVINIMTRYTMFKLNL